MWGTLISRLLCESKSRFIPTCVGNTSHHRNTPTARAVHPHVCGEHYGPLDRAVSGNGSSPRVWGTRPHVATGVSVIRFIPTCVGNTFQKMGEKQTQAVHPHVCGEHELCSFANISPYGSSPRVWGTPTVGTISYHAERFIPTCVGNTRHAVYDCTAGTVHPHVCGEHNTAVNRMKNSLGSSPRVWGTHTLFALRYWFRRFIPTCVGNTYLSFIRRLCKTVHPHVCGEHILKPSTAALRNGSSPRVWGTPRQDYRY